MYCLDVFSYGEGSLGSRAEQNFLGLECYHSWDPIHGSPCFFTTLLGCPENEFRPWLEKRMEKTYIHVLNISSGYRFKFSSQTLLYPEKENIKLWTSLDDNEVILVMIQIRAMSYMAWYCFPLLLCPSI